MMAEENVEFGAFLQVNETLSTGIREALLSIAEAALSKKLIHENTHSEVLNVRHAIEVRAQNFLKAIRDRVRIDPQTFHVFVSILENQPSMEYLASKLKQSLHNQTEDLKRRQAAARTVTQYDSSPRQMEIVSEVRGHGGQSITRPTQLVAPGELLHTSSFPSMQHVQVPAKATTFPNHSWIHSGVCRGSLITHTATTDFNLGGHEPRSEPVMKYTSTSPGMIFRKNLKLGTFVEEHAMSSSYDANAVTRRAVTPGPEAVSNSRRISSSGLTGKNVPRTFGKNYSDLQQRLDSVSNTNPDNPLPSSSPLDTQKHISTLQYPAPMTSSGGHIPTITTKIKDLSITTDPANTETAGDTQCTAEFLPKPGEEAIHKVYQASSANTGKLFALPPPSNEDGTTHFSQRTGSRYYNEAASQYPPPNGTVLQQLHGVCAPTQGSRNTKPSENTSQSRRLDKPIGIHGNLNPGGIAMMTTQMTTEPTASLHTNPPIAAVVLIEENGSNGVTESQTTAPGSDSITFHHSIMRTPSLQSGSSIDSTDDSAEVDPIQASEQSTVTSNHQAMITNGGLKPAACSKPSGEKQKRQRCKHCVKYREESDSLKKEVAKFERTLSREREQSNAQVASLREEIYHVEQQAKHVITQIEYHIMHDAELRHQSAARTIQRLQRELQLVQRERDSFKNAYDSCLERCQMLSTELQRVDSMQCPEYAMDPNPASNHNYNSMHTQEDGQIHYYDRSQHS